MPERLSTVALTRFLQGRHVAVLVTLASDGHPVPTPLWYLYRDGSLYFRTAASSAKIANLKRDPRVSVCVQDERAPYKAAIIHGLAEVRDDLDWLTAAIPRHYLGLVGALGYRASSRGSIERGAEVAIVVRPERIVSFDFAPDTPLVGRLWLRLRRALPPWL